MGSFGNRGTAKKNIPFACQGYTRGETALRSLAGFEYTVLGGTRFTVRLELAACLEKSSPQWRIIIPFAAKSTYGTVIHKSGASSFFSPPSEQTPRRRYDRVLPFTSALGPSPSRNSRPRDA